MRCGGGSRTHDGGAATHAEASDQEQCQYDAGAHCDQLKKTQHSDTQAHSNIVQLPGCGSDITMVLALIVGEVRPRQARRGG